MKKVLATVIATVMLAATPAKASSDLIPILLGVATGVVVYNVAREAETPVVIGHVDCCAPAYNYNYSYSYNYPQPVIIHNAPRGYHRPAPVYNQHGQVIGHIWAGQR
jgi:hypothetical protein